MANDVLMHKPVEVALRKSEQRFHTLVGALNAVTWSCPSSGLHVEPQAEWMEFTGQSAEEAFGDGWTKAVHPEDLAAVSSRWQAAVARGEPYANEHRIRRHDGEWRWMSVRAAPLRDASGEIVEWFGINIDITEHKQAEAALRASERRFRAIFNQQFQYSVLLTPEGRILEMSESIARGTGIDAEDVTGELFLEGPWWRDLPEMRARWRRQFEEALARPGPSRDEADYRTKDGELRYALNTLTALRDEQGKVEFLLGEGLDITERKRAEEALREADRRKDEFLATLAHELRNPLAPIRNGLDVLRKVSAEAPSSNERLLAIMDSQVDHLIRLVDDLLDISRISHGKFELRKERIDLVAVLGQAVEMSRHLTDTGGLDLRLTLPHVPLAVDGDAVRLTQVFANLLSNAASHTKGDGRIQIIVERVVDEAVVSVADTGVGITKELLPRVFDMFVQSEGKASSSKHGLGIGLALARGITEMHGGRVEARSDGEGFGSTFIVRLPLLEAAEVEAPASPSVPAGAGAARRVLVVDDAPEVAGALACLLDVLGGNVRVAHSGAQGLALCADFEPELVLLDIGMPEMDGFETARRMRELPAGRRAMLVALTGWGEQQMRARTKEAGFERHFVKPIHLKQLEELLASVCVGMAHTATAD